ncbi:MAG: hypothetical protein EOP46_21040 [Sphingobacteriaceae bacterium]|nr:MAG: hypothetical protein EOP46_21040 [Sphingobacteriaceae bacterium]
MNINNILSIAIAAISLVYAIYSFQISKIALAESQKQYTENNISSEKQFAKIESILTTYQKVAENTLNNSNFQLQHTKELIEIAEQHNLDPNKQVQLDQTIVKLTDAMGKCERIKNTVFPRSYSILIHFLIYVLMTMLPFGLDDNHWIIEIVICTLVPVLFIAIERTAILMQDPFDDRPTDTPMSTLSATIEHNLLDMIDEPLPPKIPQKETFYIM